MFRAATRNRGARESTRGRHAGLVLRRAVSSASWTFRQAPEGYIGLVEELPGANTQGATLEEARELSEGSVSARMGCKSV